MEPVDHDDILTVRYENWCQFSNDPPSINWPYSPTIPYKEICSYIPFTQLSRRFLLHFLKWDFKTNFWNFLKSHWWMMPNCDWKPVGAFGLKGPTSTVRVSQPWAETCQCPSTSPPVGTSCCCAGRLTTAPTRRASASHTLVSIKVCIPYC